MSACALAAQTGLVSFRRVLEAAIERAEAGRTEAAREIDELRRERSRLLASVDEGADARAALQAKVAALERQVVALTADGACAAVAVAGVV
jgi:ATP/maltotriose-dependent transcriptional regulator MalT